MKLHDLVEKYCLFHVLRPESQTCYKASATALITRCPEIGEGEINTVTTELLLKFRASVLSSGGSPVSFNTHRNRLRTLFRFAIREGDMPGPNPAERVSLAPVLGRRHKIVSIDTTRVLIDQLQRRGRNIDKFWVAVTKTFYYTMIRRRQLVGLRWRDIDRDRMIMGLRAESSKTRREWGIPLPVHVLPDLDWLQAMHLSVLSRQVVDPDALVFDIQLCTPLAPPLNGPRITSYYWHWGNKIGARVSPHRFRHASATTVVNSGGNIRTAQEILGHTDIKTTVGYIHPDVAAMRTAMAHIPQLHPLLQAAG